ncbi:YHYH domain-containing protein [Cupriavidus basilensis]
MSGEAVSSWLRSKMKPRGRPTSTPIAGWFGVSARFDNQGFSVRRTSSCFEHQNNNHRRGSHERTACRGCPQSSGRRQRRRCCLSVSLSLFSASVYAHGGGLDATGCHINRKTGDYHCHRGGGSATLVAPDASAHHQAER